MGAPAQIRSKNGYTAPWLREVGVCQHQKTPVTLRGWTVLFVPILDSRRLPSDLSGLVRQYA